MRALEKGDKRLDGSVVLEFAERGDGCHADAQLRIVQDFDQWGNSTRVSGSAQFFGTVNTNASPCVLEALDVIVDRSAAARDHSERNDQ